MALQTIKPTWLPNAPRFSNWDRNAILIDAAGEKAGFVFEVPKTGTISKVGFRTNSVTTAQTLRVSLQTVGATDGHPTGTLYGGSTAGTQASPASNTFYLVTLGTGASATIGDVVAAVIEFDATVGNLFIDGLATAQAGGAGVQFPYTRSYTTVWANESSMIPILAIEYSDGTYEYVGGAYPLATTFNTAFNSGSTPDERALKMNLPFSCRAIGFWWYGILDLGDCDIVLYQGTTALETRTLDKDFKGNNVQGFYRRRFPGSRVLSINTDYYLSIKPASTSDVTSFEATVNAAAMMDQFELGQKLTFASRTDAGAWTADTLRRPLIGLIIDQLDDGAGGAGGLLVHPGMSGGMRG